MFARSFVWFALILLPPSSGWAQNKGDAAGAKAAVTVVAAPSLKSALADIDVAFTRMRNVQATTRLVVGSTAIKEIASGAPADIVISDEIGAMDDGVKSNLIDAKSRFNLLGDRLVLIAPADSKLGDVAIRPGLNLAKLVGDGRIALGDVNTVPAGAQAKAALTRLGAWEAVKGKLTAEMDSRAALRRVTDGETPLGIVSAAEAKTDPKVKAIGTFPADSHPAIVYQAAATRAAGPGAALYLAFLRGATGQVLFERHGFIYLLPPGP